MVPLQSGRKSLSPSNPPNRAPDAVVIGDFLDVAVLKNRVVAVERVDKPGTPTTFQLRVLTAELAGVTTVALPGPAFRLATGANFVYDIDRDGNVGEAEDNDNDPLKATDERGQKEAQEHRQRNRDENRLRPI